MPVEVDQAIDWDSVGGLREHITALKEMVMFPLLYPEYFHRFSVTPPRCVRSGLWLALGVCTPVGAGLNPYTHTPPLPLIHAIQRRALLRPPRDGQDAHGPRPRQHLLQGTHAPKNWFDVSAIFDLFIPA